MEAWNTILNVTSKIGDGVSWIVFKIIFWLSSVGINITEVQSKIISVIVLGFGIYLIIAILSKTKKLLKWGLILAFIILILSVLYSMFV